MARSSLKNVCRLIDAAKKETSPEQDFLNDLKRSIEITAESGTKLPSKTYKPSGMNCMRASYYQIIGVEPDKAVPNYTLVGICNSGTDIHVRIQTAVANMNFCGMDCVYVNVGDYIKQRNIEDVEVVSQQGMETKLYHKKLNMSFMCDGIIKYKSKYYILELKTENSYKFLNRREVDSAHYNQATAYSVALGIDEVLFVYISRDILDMKAFILRVTDEMKEGLVMYIADCDGYVVRNEVPPKLLEANNNRVCNYCIYKTQCRKDL